MYFFYLCVCVCYITYAHVRAGTCRGQERATESLESLVVMRLSVWVWMLGTKLWPSRRAENPLNHRDTAPAALGTSEWKTMHDFTRCRGDILLKCHRQKSHHCHFIGSQGPPQGRALGRAPGHDPQNKKVLRSEEAQLVRCLLTV